MKALAGGCWGGVVLTMGLAGCGQIGEQPTVLLREAPPLKMPGAFTTTWEVDCNSPAHWDGDTLYLFSSAGHPFISAGPDLLHMGRPPRPVTFDNQEGFNGGRWIEATWRADDGTLYGWYHNEPAGVCGEGRLTAPKIGAAMSQDNGSSWRDLGIVLEAPPDSLNCQTANYYFAGGNGDFSVIRDRSGRYLYFLISTYNTDTAEQGVAVARMTYADRDAPVGKVWKWRGGKWSEPGLGGHVTPIFGVTTDWHREDANAFWGPSIHWNTHLNRYVMLLNRAKDKMWAQEGIYVSFSSDPANPRGWSVPVKIHEGGEWYPQVIGIDRAQRETDKLAGRVARFFMDGTSRYEIVFLKPGEKPQP